MSLDSGGIGVIEDLQEEVGSKGQLVNHARREYAVEHDGDIVHAAGGDLEVLLQLRTGGGGLLAVAAEVAAGERVVLIEAVVHFDDAVVAIVDAGVTVQEVVESGAGGFGAAGPEGEHVERQRIHGDAILAHQRAGVGDPIVGRGRW